MKPILAVLKKEPMLTVSAVAALISLVLSPIDVHIIMDIDWKTLCTLFVMLTILEGFKKENLFDPLIRFSRSFHSGRSLTFFLVFGVFFTSMFVTNDVSLIIFVPVTILLFRKNQIEDKLLPVLTLENIAAVRGSLLTPFGSPQNLFIFQKFGVSAPFFLAKMHPLCIMSAILLSIFICILFRNNTLFSVHEHAPEPDSIDTNCRKLKILYILLFLLLVGMIVSRTSGWLYICIFITCVILIADRKILLRTDYVLLLTFLCFFVFSSSVTKNPALAQFFRRTVSGNEYFSAILLSQIISNVPAAIVLYPFAENTFGLLYGLDTAGLCTVIGSLASVINYRLYVREYPRNGKQFLKIFTLVSLAFFAIVVLPGYFLSL